MGERGEEGRGLRGGSVVFELPPGPVYPPKCDREGRGKSREWALL